MKQALAVPVRLRGDVLMADIDTGSLKKCALTPACSLRPSTGSGQERASAFLSLKSRRR